MDLIKKRFLEALGASLQGDRVNWDGEITQQEWAELFKLAHDHQVLPMIFEAVYSCPAAKHADPQMMLFFRRQTMRSVMLQAMKTSEFLAMMKHLRNADLTPCVVKGIICRNLYPNPDHRNSGDEDVLIPPEQYERCHEALLAFGMTPADQEQAWESAYEVPYGKPGSPLYIELHKHLFPPESDAYGDFNRFFAQMELVEQEINGGKVLTMAPTDHFFYLICHSFKHFLHSGFGLRQVCDIVLYANRYGSEIDWTHVMDNCREIHAVQFTAALLRIGEKCFGFNPDGACLNAPWRAVEVDEEPMLADLLDSGIYGDATMNRKHSSTMTLDAVSSDRQGKQARGSILRTLFPKKKLLEGRYPWLRKRPWLLPVAWVVRIVGYLRESRRDKSSDAAESLRIGSERVELMRRYGIIK